MFCLSCLLLCLLPPLPLLLPLLHLALTRLMSVHSILLQRRSMVLLPLGDFILSVEHAGAETPCTYSYLHHVLPAYANRYVWSDSTRIVQPFIAYIVHRDVLSATLNSSDCLMLHATRIMSSCQTGCYDNLARYPFSVARGSDYASSP